MEPRQRSPSLPLWTLNESWWSTEDLSSFETVGGCMCAEEICLRARTQLAPDQICRFCDDQRRRVEPVWIAADQIGAGPMIRVGRPGRGQEDAGINDQRERSLPKPSASKLSASEARRPELEVPMATKLGCRRLAGRFLVGSEAARFSMTASTTALAQV